MMASKNMARWRDNLNRALFKSDNLPEFGGDEKLQRQFGECDAISSGLAAISKSIQANQIYDKVSTADSVDIDRKYQKYPNYKIAQSLLAAAASLNPPQAPPEGVQNGSLSGHGGAPSSPVVEVKTVEEQNQGVHPLALVFQGMARELESMSKQQFTVENEVNTAILTEAKEFINSYEAMSSELRNLQKHCVDVSTSEKNLEDARNKMSRVDPTSENASQLLAKHQSKVEAVQNSHKTNCDKVESDRERLRCGVQGFVKREVEIVQLMIQYVENYKNYHSLCSNMLTRLIPELEKCRDRSALSAPFDVGLEQHLEETKRSIAMPIELTCSWLYLNNAFADHGIFRIGGNVKTVRHLQEKIDRFQATEEDFTESSSMTTLLKSYLRSLQESLFTQRGLQMLKDTHEKLSARGATESEFAAKFQEIIKSLPKANVDNLKYIFTVLHGVLMNESVNKMSADNIGTCIGPSFDNTKQDLGAMGAGGDFASLNVSHTSNHIVATLVRNAVTVFDLKSDPVEFRSIKDILENPPIPPWSGFPSLRASFSSPAPPSPAPRREEQPRKLNRPVSILHTSSSSNAPQTPSKASLLLHGSHRRSSSSDKILVGTTSSSNPPLPPKPLPPDVSNKKRAPKVPSSNSKSDPSSFGVSGQEDDTSTDSQRKYAFSSQSKPRPQPRSVKTSASGGSKNDIYNRPTVAPPPPPPIETLPNDMPQSSPGNDEADSPEDPNSNDSTAGQHARYANAIGDTESTHF
ncbi:SH3 domain-binding protein 1-like isoform X2 [Symsagittifera roscoffensis]|uniref:SH3 domain-binding protein 1-like isoform X2 n=1 Tax=Symsagittifera roscoffensis TaxID=84072 RepID=UPI00307C112A